jgi:hypothetical protein
VTTTQDTIAKGQVWAERDPAVRAIVYCTKVDGMWDLVAVHEPVKAHFSSRHAEILELFDAVRVRRGAARQRARSARRLGIEV